MPYFTCIHCLNTQQIKEENERTPREADIDTCDECWADFMKAYLGEDTE